MLLKSSFTCWSWKVHVWEQKMVVWLREDHVPSWSTTCCTWHWSILCMVLPRCCHQVSESPNRAGERGAPQWQKGESDRLAAPSEVARCPQGFTGRQSTTALQTQWFPPTPQKLCPGLDEPCCASDLLCSAAGRHRAAGPGLNPPTGSTHAAAGTAALVC